VQAESRAGNFIRHPLLARGRSYFRRWLANRPGWSLANKEAGLAMEPAKLQGDYHDDSRLPSGLCRRLRSGNALHRITLDNIDEFAKSTWLSEWGAFAILTLN
jgi:hypothetical protein